MTKPKHVTIKVPAELVDTLARLLDVEARRLHDPHPADFEAPHMVPVWQAKAKALWQLRSELFK